MEKKMMQKNNFNAEDFVNRLLKEGAESSCDESSDSFNKNKNLPHFYDEKMYKRGQRFFIDNIFALLYGKFLGLISILSIPSIVGVLIHTKMSGTSLTAYKRYLATLFHMCIWYRDDFIPNSKIWQSIAEVKSKHNSASKRCSSAGLGRISQKDMALTQFGFMGYALAKREEIGLYYVDNADLKAFVHVWRVVGFLMGIEDRFNICRESLQETTEICRTLAEKVFRPAFEKKNKEFIEMTTYLSNGMWSMNPTLNAKIYLNLAYRLLLTTNNNNLENRQLLIELSFIERMFYYFLIFTRWTLQFAVFRLYHNYTQYVSLWLMRVFPFLAYYQFGYENSHIKILESNTKSH